MYLINSSTIERETQHTKEGSHLEYLRQSTLTGIDCSSTMEVAYYQLALATSEGRRHHAR